MAQSVANREVEILNQLLTLTRDSLIGYREAAAATESRAMQRCFLRRATDRQVIADRLCEVIEALGGEAADEGTRLGVAHRVFLNLCELLPSGDAIAMHEVARCGAGSLWIGVVRCACGTRHAPAPAGHASGPADSSASHVTWPR